MRQRIEGLAAYYAAKSATSSGVAALQQICELQDFYYSKHDIEHLLQVDNQFHDMLYELAGRTVIQDTLLPLHRKTMRYRRASIKNEQRLSASVAEHKQIMEAMIAGDGEQAQKLMSCHIKNAKEHMIERFVNNG